MEINLREDEQYARCIEDFIDLYHSRLNGKRLPPPLTERLILDICTRIKKLEEQCQVKPLKNYAVKSERL